MLSTIKNNQYIKQFSDSKYKNVFILSAKIIIAAGLITYLVFKIDLQNILTAFYEAYTALIFIVILMAFINIYLQYWKWKVVANKFLGELNNKKIFYSLFYGFSAGAFTPVRIGEYFGRAVAFKDKSLVHITIATLIDKFFTLIIVLFTGSIATIIFLYYYYEVSIFITISLFIVVFLLFYFLFYLILNESFWQNFVVTRLLHIKLLAKVFENISRFKDFDKKSITLLTFISLLFYSCFIIQYALLVGAFAHEFNFITFIWAGILMMFTKTVIPPVSLGELGIREGASVFFLMALGYSEAVGFNASIFLYFINVLLPALAGLILLPRKING